MKDRTRKIKKFGESLDNVDENLGTLINQQRPFLRGIVKGAEDLGQKTIFAKHRRNDIPEITKDSILTAADNISTSILSIESSIGNIIGYKEAELGYSQDQLAKNDKKDDVRDNINAEKDKANKEAEGLKSKLDEMKQYVKPDKIQELLNSNTPIIDIKQQLDEYSKTIDQILRAGGTLSQLKDNIFGAAREKVSSAGDLASGIELIQKALELISKVSDRRYFKKKAKSIDSLDLYKKLVKGGEEDKKSLIQKKGQSIKTFTKTPTKEDRRAIADFQKRVKELGYSNPYTVEGEYDMNTQESAKKAQTFLKALTGKTYSNDDIGFEEFQKDLSIYTENRDRIKKELGLQ